MYARPRKLTNKDFDAIFEQSSEEEEEVCEEVEVIPEKTSNHDPRDLDHFLPVRGRPPPVVEEKPAQKHIAWNDHIQQPKEEFDHERFRDETAISSAQFNPEHVPWDERLVNKTVRFFNDAWTKFVE